MNQEAKNIDLIFGKHVFVGTNLFSTTDNGDEISLSTKKPVFNRHYTILIK